MSGFTHSHKVSPQPYVTASRLTNHPAIFGYHAHTGVIRTFMDREKASGIRSQRQSAWRRIPIQEWCERIFRRNEGIKLAGGRPAREFAPYARSSLRLTAMNGHGGRREGAGRSPGSGDGRTVESKSVSMRSADWEIIDQMRGSASRGVYLSACLHRTWNARQNNCSPAA